MELIKVGENTYVMQNWDFTSEFVKNASTGKLELVQVLQDKTVRSKNPQMGSDEKTPLELVMEGSFDKGLQDYKNAKIKDRDHYFLSEDYLNNTGYALLSKKDFTKAIDFFRVNAILYPNSQNVYDSLGEAYVKAGQKDKAKQTYLKLLEISPKNEKAVKVLKTL
ncbi:tetratricopeptide (TPR) repeat protein [Chryseobacterium rhizosphaerae]|uniref:tetratricopeptide repeat protein n=1 Tax=Chryseobacterium rhizosphaerae TaxID=395937 RepID=UPI002861CF22|nr:tetratricopeptide repeat protein [Chryseobacterium rhizosphaerae]MDR6545097.1 tetratricopeptide (TPR) repeat protein [Chryseobacterium rhizosphaerae]